MTETFKNFKPLADGLLLSEHKASFDFTDAAAADGKPADKPFVSPALLRMIGSPQEKTSAGRLGQL
jgi:hypothetical protein